MQTKAQSSFNVGEMAVYPTQGVGVIEAIESREFSGVKSDFYILRIVDSDMKIMVPTNNVEHVGMRSLIGKKKITEVYRLLKEDQGSLGSVPSWSRRQREYNEKIRTGDLCEVAAVLKELCRISLGKELSYGEKKVMELAKRLLVTEIAHAEGKEEEKVVAKVDTILVH